MARYQTLLLTASLFAFAGIDGIGQVSSTTLVNQQGATDPLFALGPFASPVVKKAVDALHQAGFIEQDQLGYTGLTIGTAGKDDGVITAIAPQSPAAAAGLAVGDVITAVAGKPVALTPAMLASRAVFGPRKEKLSLKIMRNGSEVDLTLARDAADAPQGPTASGFMFSLKNMINWRGQFAPCMGAGVAAAAAVEVCYGRFKPFGYIKVGDFGSTGFQLDLARQDKAIVTTVSPGSAAAKAGVQPGDEIVAVDGKPLSPTLGEEANEQFFGKVGDTREVTVHRGQSSKTVKLTMTAKPKS